MLSFLVAALPILLTPGSLVPHIVAQLDETDDAAVEAGETGEEGAADMPAAEEGAADAPSPEEAAGAAEADPAPTPAPAPNLMAAQLAQRAQIRDIHRAFGIATWISLAGTLVLGGMQLHDDYGPFADQGANTPCSRSERMEPGGAIFPDFCGNAVPVPHLVSALVSSVLYYSTFTLSFFMPDPLGIAESPGWAGERLRVHKILRWFHFAGMVITSVFGAVTANITQDAGNFGMRQALAITHFTLGVTTFALLSAAALVILF